MTSQMLARSIWKTALGCAALVSTLTVQAAVFVTRWDPEFNTTFSGVVDTNIGWSGEAFITVADNCLTPAGTSWVGGSACSSATLDSGTLRMFDIDTDTVLLDLSWNRTDLGFDSRIWAISSDGTEVDGMLTFPPIEFNGQSLLPGLEVDIDLYFVIEPFAKVINPLYPWSSVGYSGPIISVTYEECTSSSSTYGSRHGGHSYPKCMDKTYWSSTDPNGENTPRPEWSQVPEPGSLALVGLALGVVGWFGRRSTPRAQRA